MQPMPNTDEAAASTVASARFIEGALARMERELEGLTHGPAKEALRKIIACLYPMLRTLGGYTLH
jgi:hypothetical protein